MSMVVYTNVWPLIEHRVIPTDEVPDIEMRGKSTGGEAVAEKKEHAVQVNNPSIEQGEATKERVKDVQDVPVEIYLEHEQEFRDQGISVI
jgi:hypothetical protein